MITVTGNSATEVFWKLWEESEKQEPEFITVDELLEEEENPHEV